MMNKRNLKQWHNAMNSFANAIKFESTKTYSIQYNIGKVKYVVNHHDGIKTHNDGSKFYDIAIFSNKQKMNAFINELKTKGYVEL